MTHLFVDLMRASENADTVMETYLFIYVSGKMESTFTGLQIYTEKRFFSLRYSAADNMRTKTNSQSIIFTSI